MIGSLISKFMTDAGLSWQTQIWVIMVPTVLYVILFFGQAFPQPKLEGAASLAQNARALLTPLYVFIFCCMAVTAITEFGPQQWVGLIMSKSGASPMLILALVTGLMAIGRFFAGPVVHKLDQTSILLGSSVFALVGIYLFSTQTGTAAYVAAIFFAIGVCYFWPTMIGFVADHIPLSGALGMSIIGGVGMFSTAIFQPIIGRWLDGARAELASVDIQGERLDLAAGQATLAKMTTFPIILIIAFTVLWFVMRNRKARVTANVVAATDY